MIKPMLAKTSAALPPESPDLVIEPKFDGWRMKAIVRESGVYLVSRTGKAITSLPYIERALSQLPVGTELDGEIVDLSGVTGEQWNRAQSICSRTARGWTHIPTPESPHLTFAAFDVQTYDGDDYMHLPLRSRRERLKALVREVGSPHVIAAPQMPCTEESLRVLLEEGWEGAIVKRLGDRYVPEDRGLWLKVKPFEEAEALCTGVFPGKGRLAGGAGGITFRITHEDGRVYEGKAKGKVSETYLQEIWDDPSLVVGRVVELIHWGVNETGALRHPNVRRFRDPADKPEPRPVEASSAPQMNVRGADLFKQKTSRPRNYAAMKDEKLLASMIAIEEGRGRDNDDRDRCLAEVRERGLVPAGV